MLEYQEDLEISSPHILSLEPMDGQHSVLEPYNTACKFVCTCFSMECLRRFHKTVERIHELTAQNLWSSTFVTVFHSRFGTFLSLKNTCISVA